LKKTIKDTFFQKSNDPAGYAEYYKVSIEENRIPNVQQTKSMYEFVSDFLDGDRQNCAQINLPAHVLIMPPLQSEIAFRKEGNCSFLFGKLSRRIKSFSVINSA